MKRIIYTAVALVICASVFGIADYLNARNKGALVNYTDEVQPTEAVSEKKTEIVTTAKDKTEAKKDQQLQSKTEKKITRAKDDHYTAAIPNLAVKEKTNPAYPDFFPGKIPSNPANPGYWNLRVRNQSQTH